MHVRIALLALAATAGCTKQSATPPPKCPEPTTKVARELEGPVGTDPTKAEDQGLAGLEKTPVATTTNPDEANTGMLRVDIVGVVQDGSGGEAVVLVERGGDRIVPIWIGPSEAAAIQLRLTDQKFPRPLTHDLLETIMGRNGMRVARVEIDALQDSTFLARLFLVDKDGQMIEIDARPSDSIALAAGSGAPIYMARSVLEQTGHDARELGLDPDTLPRPERGPPSI